MTKEYFLNKFVNKERFTEKELEELAWEWDNPFTVVAVIKGEDRRWYKNMQTVFKVDDRLFAVDWQKGLTELQDHEYWDQPYEVEEVEKTVVIKEYVKKVKD